MVIPINMLSFGMSLQRRVTCHDPCHLKKSLGVFEQPRSLLKANPEYRLVEMSQADGLATGCAACMVQISDMLSSAGDRIAVRHPLQIYAERIGCHESTAQTD